jgi:pyruvyltransferase
MISLLWYDNIRWPGKAPRSIYNLGDSINPWIVSQLAGVPINEIQLSPRESMKREDGTRPAKDDQELHYVAAGSIFNIVNNKSIVWGTGIIGTHQKINKPHKILAVRGPDTRELCLKKKWECPAVYGDPVLLLSELYTPTIEKEHDVGIIPHYVDMQTKWVKTQREAGAFIIDITKEPLRVVDEMLKCRKILSSSLHGLIVADSYRIPSVWIRLSDKIAGADFKFKDYFKSVNRQNDPCFNSFDLRKNNKVPLEKICDVNVLSAEIDLNPLLDACPFTKD